MKDHYDIQTHPSRLSIYNGIVCIDASSPINLPTFSHNFSQTAKPKVGIKKISVIHNITERCQAVDVDPS